MKDKIKILYFMDGIGNGGGIQEMAVKWMHNITRSKVQIDILSYNRINNDNFIQRIEELGGHVYIVQTFISLKYFLKSFTDLNRFFKKHNDYDILHAHSSSKAIFVMFYAKIYGIKTRILHSHCASFIMKGKFSLLAAYLCKPITKMLSTDYFACSIEAGRFLFGSKAIENNKVKIIHNAVNTDIYEYNPIVREKVRKELGIESKIVIGNIGRLSLQKNHSFLLKIFKSVVEMDDNAMLLLVGIGELEDSIKMLACKLGINDKVIFLGYRNDAYNIMQAMDILVMPSFYEGLPVTGVEAQAEGLPCVFSNFITREALILEKGDFISLDEPTNIWAYKILDMVKNYKRYNVKEIIKKKGYDIIIETKKLEDIYFEKIKLNE